MGQERIFTSIARGAARQAGRPWAFMLAMATIVVWGITGPIFGYSDTWQLVINTGTTIITFLMVFLIQNAQNRDTEALHIKLDELIRATNRARNSFMSLEDLSENELAQIRRQLEQMQEGCKPEKLEPAE
ncbi:low affinity iron permease family protein [Rhodovarius crocodyli]|uniref:Low affinity iron permease family protein n=1 Tax=Rhodovarius crocodyli TaxID=1979269 RepID=A0A437MN43_9PROT|nr:low affinity iron permease family protein [Rhodovarius crocodyli]RVT99057.1 low affinity iron permease family protein [Rhodovarius crocodyli]